MAESDQKNREKEFHDFALLEPELSIGGDLALEGDRAYRDRFNLRYRVGPVYDILRHPDTETPMAVAIYGDWGMGKTTAMKWLEGTLQTWNKHGEANGKIKVKPVWFYPWKYHSRDDVWRGLVAEVILQSIDVKNADLARVTKAAKQFGVFLGRSFLHVLSGVKLKGKVKDPSGLAEAEAEFSLSSVRDVYDEYRQAAHPEKAYLNDFEDSLRSWVHDTLGKNERMVIFIDDLDRCMPEVALQVLEALKLYLNIDRLIFVVGIDDKVILDLVKKHYVQLGLKEEKSEEYLAKMFQVEVKLAPTERQIEAFFDDYVGSLSYWNEQLDHHQRALFRKIILERAQQNPREVKRLVNSALMAGVGALMSEGNPS